MKALLIDDKANRGWHQLFEKLFPVKGLSLESAVDISTAVKKLEQEYDIIFLDVRLDGNDHFHREIENYTGFKILSGIKSKFINPNYSTPIILITASNKIWSINAFLDYGVDAYYIKEHPESIFNKETSKENYDNLKSDFQRLLTLGPARKMIWVLSKQILYLLSSNKYFKDNSGYINVKNRVSEKIKLGYYYRFKSPNTQEKDVLKVYNQSISFLIYFSILEDLCKGYTNKSSWDSNGNFSGKWKFRNNKDFIYLDDDYCEINPFWEEGRYNIKKIQKKNKRYTIYSDGRVNLSDQVYALLYHYHIPEKYKNSFRQLNSFRNKLNYTHSSVTAIYNRPLVDSETTSEFEKNIIQILELIIEILRNPK